MPREKVMIKSPSSDDEDDELICKDFSPDLKLEEEDEEITDLKQIDVGNFVICKVYGKKTTRHYAAKIEKQKKT
ncbi:hypothetical protein ILUMI_00963 [Ignelater luminosus]|uniref:Uncharacterized protein n=1 Tax=Ignelater luminosus TaxID=2038154 RepID=A0A8K0DJG2_IGNLU|nr:hypothetical protein ILUMI_00963 [Ignelater luminosus]